MGYSKEEAIKKIEEQQGDSPSFEIFTSEEHVTFLENHVTDQLDKSIGDNAQGGEKTAIRKAFDSSLYKVHQQYEDDLFEKTGIRKEKTEKTYDALKRVLGDLQEKSKTIPGLQSEIAGLKDGKTVDESLKKENEDLLKKYNDLKDESDTKLSKLKSEQSGFRVTGELDRATQGLKFKEDIPEDVRKIVIANTKRELANIAEYDDEGKLIFKENGVTMKNKEKNLAPYTAEDLIRERLSSIIDDGIQLLGTGVKPKLNKDKDGKDDILIDIPDSVVTTEDLHKHLVGLSLSRNSKEYQKAWEKYSPDLKRPGF